MAEDGRSWLAKSSPHHVTCAAELGLRAASGVLWQKIAHYAASDPRELEMDHFDPARKVISEYLRYTGRYEEAFEVEAIGCNEALPAVPAAGLSATQRSKLRQTLRRR